MFPPVLKDVLAHRILYSKRQMDRGHWVVRQAYAALCKRFSGSLRAAVIRFGQNTAHRNNFTHRGNLINKFRKLCEISRRNELYIELRRRLLTVQLMMCICRSTSPQYVYCNNFIAPMCYFKMHFYNYKENICVMC